jgi:hypothetical protein
LLFDGVGNLKDIEQSPVIGVSSQAPALPHAAVVDSTLEPFSVMDTPPLNELPAYTKYKLDLNNEDVIGHHIDELVSDTDFADIDAALADDAVKKAILNKLLHYLF